MVFQKPIKSDSLLKSINMGLILLIALFSASFTNATTIMVHGDSLSAGYGMLPEETWVSLLGRALPDKHIVINTSVSGETSKGGLDRLPALLDVYNPQILIIELGANDGLRGYPIAQMTENIQKMIDIANLRGMSVLLVGIRLPPNFGKRYTEPFFHAFEELATDNNLNYLPFLLEGVAQHSNLMQSDGLHPTKNAQAIILENIKPIVIRTIETSSNPLP